MGLFKKYVNQVRKPEGFLGQMMIDDIKNALKGAGFKKIVADHHGSKPWITVIASK